MKGRLVGTPPKSHCLEDLRLAGRLSSGSSKLCGAFRALESRAADP